ncbi:MAG: hypothetical protein HOP34_16150 [Methylococcaceae bacterium]|nr:hypothetical protein [Methylococcaceae bacterium]
MGVICALVSVSLQIAGLGGASAQRGVKATEISVADTNLALYRRLSTLYFK